MKNLVLCGFMGSGKTTVGKIIADMLSAEFVDTDSLIETSEKMRISDIFEQYGEAYFRKLESKICKELSRQSNLVISTGGGALTFPDNANLLSASGIIVFLDVSQENIISRLKSDNSRPLLSGDKESSIKNLLSVRLPIYKNVSQIIVNANNNPEHVALEVVKQYKHALKQ